LKKKNELQAVDHPNAYQQKLYMTITRFF